MRFAKGVRRQHIPGVMNKTEAEYALTLAAKKAAGEIQNYWFECFKIKLADKTYYTPDFMVMANDDVWEAHEVKGFWEDDARVKVKVFAETYPIRVRCFTKRAKKNGGGWEEETMTKGEERKDGAK